MNNDTPCNCNFRDPYKCGGRIDFFSMCQCDCHRTRLAVEQETVDGIRVGEVVCVIKSDYQGVWADDEGIVLSASDAGFAVEITKLFTDAFHKAAVASRVIWFDVGTVKKKAAR
jgi:hypothetical protein